MALTPWMLLPEYSDPVSLYKEFKCSLSQKSYCLGQSRPDCNPKIDGSVKMASSYCADFVQTIDFNLIPADKKLCNKKGVKIKQEGDQTVPCSFHFSAPSENDISVE
jgi:hypothetical protein